MLLLLVIQLSFDLIEGNWIASVATTINSGQDSDLAGSAVALSNNGNLFVTGAPFARFVDFNREVPIAFPGRPVGNARVLRRPVRVSGQDNWVEEGFVAFNLPDSRNRRCNKRSDFSGIQWR